LLNLDKLRGAGDGLNMKKIPQTLCSSGSSVGSQEQIDP